MFWRNLDYFCLQISLLCLIDVVAMIFRECWQSDRLVESSNLILHSLSSHDGTFLQGTLKINGPKVFQDSKTNCCWHQSEDYSFTNEPASLTSKIFVLHNSLRFDHYNGAKLLIRTEFSLTLATRLYHISWLLLLMMTFEHELIRLSITILSPTKCYLLLCKPHRCLLGGNALFEEHFVNSGYIMEQLLCSFLSWFVVILPYNF